METKEIYSKPEQGEIFSTKDGKSVTFEELGVGFLNLMASSQKILEFLEEKKKQKIIFMIKVYLVDRDVFPRTKLDSEKAMNLINRIYEYFISRLNNYRTKAKPVFSENETVFMTRQARLNQLREKKRGGLSDEKEKDVFGQTVEEFDKSVN